ncbi:MAG: hypothetical protein ABIS07_09270 [Dokdonella sp.]
MKKSIVLVIVGSVASIRAFACGPDFPTALLDDRVGTLADLPRGVFASEAKNLVHAPAKSFKANEAADWIYVPAEHATRDDVERRWLGNDYERAQSVRAQSDADMAYASGEGLPEDARRYLAGAVAFAHGELAVAGQRFASVLALPPMDRKHYEVWAVYMQARSFAEHDPQQSMHAYAQVRERVAAGAEDPLGLALDSYGEEARLHVAAHDIPAAVRLYAEQAAQGSRFGDASLALVAQRVLRDPASLQQAVHDPLSRKLLAVYLRTRGDGFIYDDIADAGSQGHKVAAGTAPLPSTAFADALEHVTIEDGDGVAQLAAFAYQHGRYELAAKFAAKSHEGPAAWVRAKLALRAGELPRAAAAYAEAVKAFPVYVPKPATDDNLRDGDNDYCRVQGEAGTLALARSEYVAAMEHLYAAAPVYSADAAFVAERVLTVEELHAFVDAHAGEAAKAQSMQEGGGEYTARPFAATLARRFLRAERWDEAPAYFDDPIVRKKAHAYADARRSAVRGGDIERAQAWYQASVLARQNGMELLGYDYGPDMASWGGSFENVYAFGYGPSRLDDTQSSAAKTVLPFEAGPGADERRRAEATRARPDKRFHYRYVAAEFAARGADLVPHRSQAYAALLCAATGYVLNTDVDSARTYWRRYVKDGPHVAWAVAFGTRCEVPDFADAERRRHSERVAAFRHAARKALPYAVVGGLALLAFAALAWQRRRARNA